MIPFNPFSALTSKIYGGIAIAALTFGAVQTMRIEGFLFIHGFKQDVAERDKQIAALIEASKTNRIAAEKQAHEQQSKLDQITREAKNAYKAGSKDADIRFAAYRSRMRIKDGCISPTPATAEGNNPGVPPDVPPDSGMVAIRSDELQNLIDWFKVGLSAHNQAVDKVNSGAALPDPAMGR